MVNVISKLSSISVSCKDYVHPWTDSCKEATAGLYLYALADSLRIYGTVYTLALLMRGKIPNFSEIEKTLAGIAQSTAFLSATSFGYSAFLCTLRRVLGNFNILTVSAVPVFLSSMFAIFIERQSRRPLLCLYVCNVATETVWNMLLSRNMVRPIPYGQTLIFTFSMALLLYYYKTGRHRIAGKTDSIFSALRYVIGPHEEHGHSSHSSDQSRASSPRARGSGVSYGLIQRAIAVYSRIVTKIKTQAKSPVCPHPHSCVYYGLQGSAKMLTVGLLAQSLLKLLFNLRTVMKNPSRIQSLLLRRDTLSLAAFLAGFSGTYRLASCALRWLTGRDAGAHAVLGGLLAGAAFTQYSDSTIALYVMWKALQLTYSRGIEAGLLPTVPYFTEFLYCLSTATLFHAGIIEPHNLRPSYWKFLHSLSGGRIACMDRESLDVWGVGSSQSLMNALKHTKTERKLKFYFNL